MEPIIGSARLFSAFEKTGHLSGAELRSPTGPGGSPANSVIREFEEAISAQGGIQETSGNMVMRGAESDFSPKLDHAKSAALTMPAAPGPAQYMPGPQGESMLRVEGSTRAEPITQRGHTAMPASEPDILQSPVELYRAQYQIGILRAQVDIIMKSSQSMTQSLESALKQSG